MTLTTEQAQAIAQTYVDAKSKTCALSTPPSGFDPESIEQGYFIQKQWFDIHAKAGKSLTGWKAAMSNQAAFDRFNLTEPLYGALFEDMLIAGDVLESSKVIAPKIEAEIVFILGEDITQNDVSDEDILSCVSHLCPAFEIADSRQEGWSFKRGSFLADNAVASYYKLGEKYDFKPEMMSTPFMCRLLCGETEIIGSSENVLNEPLGSFLSMVRQVISLYGTVKEGQHFLSGTLTRPIDMTVGETYKLNVLDMDVELLYK
ncbi:MAG: hypothetical protein HWE34_14915 [Methylocystaceae bacterium]|nr:hypothetical protein [Methylocystaceae bacterium]